MWSGIGPSSFDNSCNMITFSMVLSMISALLFLIEYNIFHDHKIWSLTFNGISLGIIRISKLFECQPRSAHRSLPSRREQRTSRREQQNTVPMFVLPTSIMYLCKVLCYWLIRSDKLSCVYLSYSYMVIKLHRGL